MTDNETLLPSDDQHVLFGLLAWQHGVVTREQLVAALRAVIAGSGSLPGELISLGALTQEQADLLAPMVAAQVQLYGGDVSHSLRAIGSPLDLGTLIEQLDVTDDVDSLGTRTLLPESGDGDAERPQSPGRPSEPRFSILRPHARGGLGEVFVARDRELNRDVALKEIQARHAFNRDSQSRFLLEAEITGGLEHPGIVPVYGLGTYDDGRPFYAMRFIRGDSLDAAIRDFHDSELPEAERNLRFRELLKRFVDVCNAIAYAHSRGVLHRDLKPGNIMLGHYGETLVVDWGLAKTLDGEPDSEESPAGPVLQPLSGTDVSGTIVGTAIGTPGYMSPEQAEGRVADLGPATDVYAMGATLHHILTGRAPRPSLDPTAVSNVSGVPTSVTVDPPSRPIPRALEAVCHKAMAHNPADRYSDLTSLSDEVERWLADEPVTAWREPLSLRAKRWIKRHQTLALSCVSALFVIVVSLTALSIVVASKNQELDVARQDAEDQRDLAVENETRALNAERDAVRTAAIASAVNDFLQDDLLAQASPENETDRDIKLRDVLDRASAVIGGRFPEEPVVEAAVRDTLGTTYEALGELDAAEEHLERSLAICMQELGEGEKRTLQAISHLAVLRNSQGRIDEAEELHTRALRLRRQVLGDANADTVTSMINLAGIHQERGDSEKAIALNLEALEISRRVSGDRDHQTLALVNNLATVYEDVGRYADAMPMYEQTLKVLRETKGSGHPHTLLVMINCGRLATAVGEYDRAEVFLTEAVETSRKVLPDGHVGTRKGLDHLARLYSLRARNEEAGPLYQELVTVTEKQFGPDHAETLHYVALTSSLYRRIGDLERAEQWAKRALEGTRRAVGTKHMDTVSRLSNLAGVYKDLGRYTEAAPLYREAIAILHELVGPDHPSSHVLAVNLGGLLSAQRKFEEAEPMLRQAYEALLASSGPDAVYTEGATATLAGFYLTTRRFAEALPLCERVLQARSRRMGRDSDRTKDFVVYTALAHLETGALEKAEPPCVEAAEWAETLEPDSWQRCWAESVVAALALRQERFGEAQESLERAATGLLGSREQLPLDDMVGRVELTLTWLIAACEGAGDTAAAKKWSDELSRL